MRVRCFIHKIPMTFIPSVHIGGFGKIVCRKCEREWMVKAFK